VESIVAHHNMIESLNDDLNVGDIFDSKEKLQHVISECSIKHLVTFKLVKTNKT